MTRHAPAALALATLATLTGCGNDPAPEHQCRTTARQVFEDVATDKATTEQGQARVDQACKDVAATARQAIVDAERGAAIARHLADPEP